MPKGRTFLHNLAISQNENTNDQVEASNACRMLFEVASDEHDLDITGTKSCSFEIPILPDIYGFTVLDYCLGTDRDQHEKKP